MRAAACSSASRSPRFNSERAFARSRRDTSRSTTRATLIRSKRSVYSSTAASPLARTPARIAATSSSTFWSKVVSNAVSALRRVSKSGSLVESRAISGMFADHLRKCVEKGLDRIALQLERGLVDDQTGTDRADLFDGLQAIGTQGIAGRHQVDDRVGQAEERSELHRAVELDEIDMHALRREVLTRRLHVLGRDAQARPPAHGARVVEALGNGHHHPAGRDTQIERLVEPLSAVLEQHVFSRDTQFRRAVLDVSRNIGGAHDEQTQVAAAGSQYQLARAFRIVERAYPRRCEQRQGLVEDAALGERERDHGSPVRINRRFYRKGRGKPYFSRCSSADSRRRPGQS